MLNLIRKKNVDFHIEYRICGLKFRVVNKKYINSQTLKKIEFPCDNLNISDEEKLKKTCNIFNEHVGYYPNLKTPVTFDEKMLWLKFNYNNPIFDYIIDKYEFKNYIKEKLGDGYTIPLIKTFEDIDDIDFRDLPDKFVLKLTRGGGGEFVKIIRDKKQVNLDKLKFELKYSLGKRRKFYFDAYGLCKDAIERTVQEKVIIEEYMEQFDGQLCDYKFFCFHGEPKAVEAIKNRKNGDFCASFYDVNWEPLNLKSGKHNLSNLSKPETYDKMLEISKILSKDFPFVRVDLYVVQDKIYVGEMTFTPASGFMKFNPREWDYKFGEWLDLSKISEEFLTHKDI